MEFTSDNELIEYSEHRCKSNYEFTVKHSHGVIVLDLYRFFESSTQKQVKQLYRLIVTESYDVCKLLSEIEDFLKTEINFFKDWARLMAIKYVDESHQKVCDTEQLLKTQRHPNGVHLTKEEFQQAEKNLKLYKRIERVTLQEHKRAVRQFKRLTKFLDLLEAI